MQPADRLTRSASARLLARRLVLWGGLGAGALALSSLAAFAQGHALMINVSPTCPTGPSGHAGAPVHRGDIILFDPPTSPLLVKHFGAKPKPFGKQ